MIRISLLVLAMAIAAFFLACGSSPANNSNVYLTNANSANNANNANVPAATDAPVNANVNSSEGNSPIASTAPGIPAGNSITPLPKGATPTPGIPSPANANKMAKPGVTPTPGIPDSETLRRQMQGLDTTNLNAAPGGDMRMQRMKRGNGLPNKSVANRP